MPAIHLDDEQLAALAAFLLKLTPKNAEALQATPDNVVQGAIVYETNHCGNCHTANGEGMKVGPTLNGLARRRTKEWIEAQIRRPQSHTPDSMMQPYPLEPRDMERLVAYLLSLPYVKPFSVAFADTERLAVKGEIQAWRTLSFLRNEARTECRLEFCSNVD